VRDYRLCGKPFAGCTSFKTSSTRLSILPGLILRSGSNANIQSPTRSNCKPAADRPVLGVLGGTALIANKLYVCVVRHCLRHSQKRDNRGRLLRLWGRCYQTPWRVEGRFSKGECCWKPTMRGSFHGRDRPRITKIKSLIPSDEAVKHASGAESFCLSP
jgi:hypothetical protein